MQNAADHDEKFEQCHGPDPGDENGISGTITEAKGSFPLHGSNWIRRPADKDAEATWKSDVALLNSMHKTLREAVAALNSSDLAFRPAESKVTNLELITGIAAHDLYHAGQIQLLKRLRPG